MLGNTIATVGHSKVAAEKTIEAMRKPMKPSVRTATATLAWRCGLMKKMKSATRLLNAEQPSNAAAAHPAGKSMAILTPHRLPPTMTSASAHVMSRLSSCSEPRVDDSADPS